jgi:hypothetical protein
MLTHNLAKLVTTLPERSFQKWGLDSIGSLKPTNRLLGNLVHFNGHYLGNQVGGNTNIPHQHYCNNH